MLDRALPRIFVAGILLAAGLETSASAQELLQLGEVCSYYGEEIDDAVYGFASDTEAEEAVQQIVDHTGLPQNFTIKAANVPNAAAQINENGDRLILYNQTFMKRITETVRTDWAATSILAHEIGHHLSGHTLKPGGSRPEIELQADTFSGFVLFKMGADLDDAQAAMEAFASTRSSRTHPPKSARLAAIANGWTRAKEQSGGANPSDRTDPVDQPTTAERDQMQTPVSEEGQLPGEEPIGNSFVAQCGFYDGSAVSVDQQNRILTFLNGATIDVGVRRGSSVPDVQYELYLTSNDIYIAKLLTGLGVYNVTYYVDTAGTIWRPNGYGGYFPVGTCQ